MADCLAAWRGAAVGAGPADQGALPDLSRRRRHAAGLCAIRPVLDAGARSGAGAVRGAGLAGCRLRHLAARPPGQLAAGLDAGIHRGRRSHRRGAGVGLYGILTIVAYAITIARTAPARTPARLRVPSYAVWETAVFVLNVLAFMLIGMQLRPIWTRLDDPVRLNYCLIAAAVLGAVILTRIAWVAIYGTTLRLLIARGFFQPGSSMAVPTVRGGIVVAWCGMRGIVTLAAAFALPERFPDRDLMLLTACAVVLGSLVIQGLTLRPLISALHLKDENPAASEVARARAVAYRAALEEIDREPSEEAETLRIEYRA